MPRAPRPRKTARSGRCKGDGHETSRDAQPGDLETWTGDDCRHWRSRRSPHRRSRPILPAEARKIVDEAKYKNARWGVHVADLKTGEVLFDWNGDQRFLAASTTKLWAGAAALDAYGADYRFTTPIYRTGAVDGAGTLTGNLVMVASADPTMGGRTTPQGTIDFTPIDHIYAAALPLSTLTPENPLAGLDDLAKQVAASGIRRVAGDVIIDARLFPAMEKDGYIVSPVWINDNLIDFTVTPGAVGSKASCRVAAADRRLYGRVRRHHRCRGPADDGRGHLAQARSDCGQRQYPRRPATAGADLPGAGSAGLRPHPADRGVEAARGHGRRQSARPQPRRRASAPRAAIAPMPRSRSSSRRRFPRTSS